MNKTLLLYSLLVLATIIAPATQAFVDVAQISTDPAVIAAGDEVDITIDYSIPNLEERAANPDWKLKVYLETDDAVSESFIRITDAQGDDALTVIGATITKRTNFRVKVLEDAPAGEYELALIGEWYRNGVLSGAQSIDRFTLDVKREGILLRIADIQSTPQRLLPGTREAALAITISNNGEKVAQDLVLQATLPDGMRPSYASGSRLSVGSIGDTATATLYVDVDKDLPSGEYILPFLASYVDESQNTYTKELFATVYVAQKPQLVLSQETLSAKTGSEVAVTFTITNTGSVTAEAIDVRLLKESSQPFILDTRSVYISTLEPQESQTVVLPVTVEKTATAQEYSIPVFIRAKGDSEENDETIYTFREDVELSVTLSETNKYYAVAIGTLIVIGILFLLWRRK